MPNDDFDILLNGGPMPPLVQIKADTSTVATLTLVARNGTGSAGAPWTVDTEGTLLPLDNIRGNLASNGHATIVVGPAAMLGSVLRGNAQFDVKINNHHKAVNLLFY